MSEQVEPKDVKFEELPESWQKEIKKLRDEAAERRVKSRELESRLETLESGSQSAENSSADGAVAGQNFEQLYNELKSKYENDSKELDSLKTEIKSYRERARIEFENELGRLPEAKRELYKNAPIEIIREVASLYKSEDAPHSPGSEQHAESGALVRNSGDDKSGGVLDELAHIARNNPRGYAEWANRKKD